jgi:O-antigen ligase
MIYTEFAASLRTRRPEAQILLLLALLIAGIYLVLPLPLLGDQISIDWLSGIDRAHSWRVALPWCCIAVAAVAVLLTIRLGSGSVSLLAAAVVLDSLLAVRSPSDTAFLFAWIAFFLALSLRRAFRVIGFAFWAACLAAQVCLAVAAYLVGYWQMHTPGFGYRASGFYGTPNVVYPVVLIAVFTFGALTSEFRARRAALTAGVGMVLLSGVVLVLTFTRAAWLGAFAGFIAVGWHAHRRFRRAWVAVALAFLLGTVFIRTHGGLVGSGNDASGRNRPLIWKHAVHVWEKSPWIGHGFSAFARAEVVGEPPPGLPYLPGEPKNLYLNILVEQGLLGLAFYGMFLAAALSTAWRLWNNVHAPPVDRAIAGALFPSLIAILVAGLVDTPAFGPLMRVPGTATLLVFIGLVAGADAGLKRAAEPPK